MKLNKFGYKCPIVCQGTCLKHRTVLKYLSLLTEKKTTIKIYHNMERVYGIPSSDTEITVAELGNDKYTLDVLLRRGLISVFILQHQLVR